MLKSVCPILPSRDFDATSAFYGKLGFREAARFDVEGYSILVRDNVELHFFNHSKHDPDVSEHGAFVRVDDAADLSARFETIDLPSEGIPRFAKAENKPWGVCELQIVDPDGNLLRMGHIVDER
ncbi:bleomycin resistance protein [Aestuariibius sp. 2305UL40-4]|uniref:bleomycin resistance protein n=1 Tax=Aestuariibius violaceus TaxID=3234132 RepID=UPI0034925D53